MPRTVLLIGDATSSWMRRTASIVANFGARPAVAASCAHALDKDPEVDVVVVHVVQGADPLLDVANMWGIRAQVPVIFLGDEIDDTLRSAALEAGVAHVAEAEPMPAELEAMIRIASEQSRLGSPELVRAMCRTMCSLSSLVAQAKDTSFLSAAVLQLSGLFQAPIVSIMLFDGDDVDATMRVIAQVGLGAGALYGSPRKDGVADRVVKARVPQIILRSAAEARQFSGVQGRAEIMASMCVPIPGSAASSRPRGVINVAKTRACSVFTPRDLDMCASIAGLIGDALMLIETKEIQAQLTQRLTAAERLSTIGEIAAGIAHEVANPIACVRANVDTVIAYMTELAPELAKIENTPDITAILDDLPALLCETWEGLQRTEDVVKQMKSLVRLNSGGGASSREETVPLGKLVEDTLRLLRPRMKVPVRVDIEQGVCVRGNSVELSQLLVNLVVNAGDACEERKHEAEVRVAVGAADGFAAIHVVDNGCGIPLELQKRIFMPLFTTKPAERGTGLGLSIVRRVANDHGGSVRVHSTPGSGTAFVVSIPLLEKSAPIAADPSAIIQ